MKKAKVIMLSPDLDVRGGIAFVVQEYFKGRLKEKVDLDFIATHKDGSHLKKIRVFLGAYLKFLGRAPTLRSSIVHLHTSQDGSFVRKFLLFVTARLFGATTLVHIHGSQFDAFMTKNRLWRTLTKFYFDRADLILVMSNLWVGRLENFTTNKNVVLLYNPVSIASRAEGHDERLNILFLGRLGQRKGIYDLLECINRNKDYFQLKHAHFILAGDGEVESVRKFVREHGLENLVDVPGWIVGEQKANYLRTSNILILPSYSEQMPMSILEAMGYGYPILATNVAGIPEMVEHGENGYLFEPGDISAMSESLTSLCDDAELRKKMGQKSQAVVKERFENTRIVDQLVSIYEGL